MDSMIKQSIQKAVIQLEDKTDNSRRATERIMIIHNLVFQDSRTTCEYKPRPRIGWGFLFMHRFILHIANHGTGGNKISVLMICPGACLGQQGGRSQKRETRFAYGQFCSPCTPCCVFSESILKHSHFCMTFDGDLNRKI